ncbi:MAG: NAD-dependent epimerase/dehydratase family protein [Methanogenium sp.]|jgi:GDP-L-fucose synthase
MDYWYDKEILITGGKGMVGHALCRLLEHLQCGKVTAVGSKDCDLRDFGQTKKLFERVRPKYVFHLAGKVYGLGGNALHKADVLFDNVMINTNSIECSRRFGVKKMVVMGSGCVYPEGEKGKGLTEDQIWLGEPHGSEDSYAHAKRLALAQLIANKNQYGMDYAYAISGNLYGEFDKFDVEKGHVIPSLIAKFCTAKTLNKPVIVWGTGIAVRDFSYSGDTARALVYLMNQGDGPINIGSGFLHPIKDIVDILSVYTQTDVIWDSSKPDGQLERYYDLSKLHSLGFLPTTDLKEGLKKTLLWYMSSID